MPLCRERATWPQPLGQFALVANDLLAAACEGKTGEAESEKGMGAAFRLSVAGGAEPNACDATSLTHRIAKRGACRVRSLSAAFCRFIGGMAGGCGPHKPQRERRCGS